MALRSAVAASIVVAVAPATIADDRDTVSMVQHSGRTDQPTVDLGIRQWMGSFYSIVKTQQDPLLGACCAMAANLGVKPWSTWGRATTEQQDWWTEVQCNAVVGAEVENYAVGTPNCQTVSLLTALVPKSLVTNKLELTSESSQCSMQDRRQINSTYLGLKDAVALPEECSPTRMVGMGPIKWNQFGTCVQLIHGSSESCGLCYSDLLRKMADLSEKTNCFKTCFPLEACASLRYCVPRATQCATCIQPLLNDHRACVGGPVENPLNVEDLMRKLVHVWGS